MAQTSQRRLTPRSRRGPTASHQARPGGTRYIFASPGLASCRRSRLNSNVRQRKPPLVPVQLLRLQLVKARAKTRRHPRVSHRTRHGANPNIWRVFAGAFSVWVCMNSILRVGTRHSRARPVPAHSEVAFAEVAVAVPSLRFGRPAFARSSGGPFSCFASVCAPDGTAS